MCLLLWILRYTQDDGLLLMRYMEHVHEFLYEPFFLIPILGHEFVRGARIQVALEDQVFGAPHESERSIDLLGYIHTVPVVFHHLFYGLKKSSGLLEVGQEFGFVGLYHGFWK